MRITKKTVIDTAADIADKNGLHGVSLKVVAERLNIKTPSLYNHIENLDDLLREVAHQGMRNMNMRLERAAIGKIAGNAIKAVGRSDIFLKLEIIKKIIGLASIILTMRYGVMAMALGLLVITPLNALINAFPNRKILNYSIKEQIKDLMPYILMAGAMGALVWPIQYLQISRILVIVAQIAAGIVVYVGCSVIFRVDVFYDLFGILTGFLRKGSKNGAAE